MPSPVHIVFSRLAAAPHADLARQVQYLLAENRILRARLPTPIRATPAERAKLIKYGQPLGLALDRLITIVKPATFRRWLKGGPLYRNRPSARRGRPRKPEELRGLVVRMAVETGWGYARIAGELRTLGFPPVSKATVRAILKEHGIDPAPLRGAQTWDDFLARHARTLWACDFFTTMAWTWKGLVPFFTIVFMHVASRRVIVTRSTRRPDQAWVLRQAEFFTAEAARTGLDPPAILLRDNDTKFGPAFDRLLAGRGVFVRRLPYRSPWLNGYVERWIRTVREECLNHFVILGSRHLDYLVEQFAGYYHRHRPHQGKGNELLIPPVKPPPREGAVVARHALGGLLKHYERRAA